MVNRVVPLALVISSVALAAPAAASFHLMKIVEVFAGTSGAPDAQYVMLQMLAGGQNQVGGHSVTAFDANGDVAGTFNFAGSVANGANQATILIATPEAEALFGVTADLAMTPVLDPTAGKVCFDNIDCVAWGAFGGALGAPSPAGTPYGPAGGFSQGHTIRRDTSRGNPAILDGADDTNNSFVDFQCSDTAAPRNNAGSSGLYVDPDPCPTCGNDTVEIGEMCDGTDDASCPGGCQLNCLCPTHDSFVAPLKPLTVKVPSRQPFSVERKVTIRVGNVDAQASSNVVKLSAGLGDCPPGVSVSQPDFLPPSGVDTTTLAAGKTAKAVVFVGLDQTAFTTFNRKAPARCTLEFTASTEVPGNVDPNPSNNVAVLELNVIDLNDTPSISPPNHESLIVSAKPLKLAIGRRKPIAAKKFAPAVINADLLPVPDSGDLIAVSIDTSGCAGVSATIDMDKKTDGLQASIAVDGGRSAKGLIVVEADAHDITTNNRRSPQRCFATVTATGPSDPDPDPSNNQTTLVIDIVDGNDF